MTQSNESTQPKSSNAIIWWILGGCGCLFLGTIVLGILAAIALPSFLNQANKARESEGKQFTGSMLRAQQAYFLEQNKFAPDISALQIGLSASTENYKYEMIPQPGNPPSVVVTASAKKPTLKSFTGVVVAVKDGKDMTTLSKLCQTEGPSATPPTEFIAPKSLTEELECPAGSKPLN